MNLAHNTTLDLFAPPLAEQLHAWQQDGVLRQLDVAWMDFVRTHDPHAHDCLLLVSTLLAHMEGRGHSCLPLAAAVHNPAALLAWDSSSHAALAAQWQQLPRSLAAWLAAISASPLVRVVGRDADLGQPMVLAGADTPAPLLYLRRYWHHERLVAQHVLARSQADTRVDTAQLQHWLQRLFPTLPAPPVPPTPPDAATPVDWQKTACALALHGGLTIITGGPGTGKTYTAARLLALLFATAPQASQLRVALAAPTGKAAARLKQAIDQALLGLHASLGAALDLPALVERTGAARTLHSLLGAQSGSRQLRHHQGQPLEVDVLIVDEASMVHLEMMAALLDALPPQARLIILGDKDQLASVEAGAVLGDLCRDAAAGRYTPTTVQWLAAASGCTLPAHYQDAQGPALAQHTAMLRRSHRFSGPIGQLALAVNQGDSQAAHQALTNGRNEGGLHTLTAPRLEQVWQLALAAHRPSYRAYATLLAHQGDASDHSAWARAVLQAFESFRLLCAIRAGDWGVTGLNQAIERQLVQAGLLTKGQDSEWYTGRPVMVTRNDPALGVFNGDIGIALPSPQGAQRVYFLDGEALRSVGVTRLAHVETAFAMTVHKSQGSEFTHAAVVLPATAGHLLGRELLYTGITRAKQHCTLVQQRPGLLEQAMAQPTQRNSGLLRFLAGEFS